MSEISRIISETRAYACLDCGKCTVACPISKYDPAYSPRKFVQSLAGQTDALQNGQLWQCLACARCEARCQSGVNYTGLTQQLRAEAHKLGGHGECTHGGALQATMQIMGDEKIRPNRLGWVDKGLKTAPGGEMVYFAGCAPYFDVIFADIGAKTLSAAKGAVKLLNALGITPALMPGERCCGHDLLWAGDIAGFEKLARLNVKQLSETGAKKVVTTCPECYHTLKYEYPRQIGALEFDVVHISQLLAEPVAKGRLKFRQSAKKVTYHDPCRLGRLSGIYDEPRSVLKAAGLQLVEMPRHRATALCCGTQAWLNCGAVNKQIQAERLREAKATGADTLVTACPKCQIHLKCALHGEKLDKEIGMEIIDLTGLLAQEVVV